MFVEHPRSTAHKGYWHKHCCHYQSDRNNRSCNLVHSRNGSRFSFLVSLLHFGVHRLDDDYRIIHHYTDSQYQGKEGEHIDRITKEVQEEESTHDRHWHRNSRNERRAEVLQENIHYQEH